MPPTKSNKTETEKIEKNKSMFIVFEIWWLNFDVVECAQRIYFKRDLDDEYLNLNHKRIKHRVWESTLNVLSMHDIDTKMELYMSRTKCNWAIT